MDILVILLQMIQLFLLIALGYILYLTGMLDQEMSRRLTSFVLSVTTPALILSSVLSGTGSQDTGRVLAFLLIAVIMYAVLPMIGWLTAVLMRAPREQQGLYMFMTVFGNIGYMGFPVIRAIFGDDALLYAAIFNMIFNLFLFTVGRWMMSFGTGSRTKMDPKSLISPGVLSSIAALLVYFAGIRVPEVVSGTVTMVGDMTTPLAMMLIGSSLASIPAREVFTEFRIYPFTLIKQVLIPGLAYLVLRMMVSDPMVLGVTLIMIAMPVGSIGVLFATEYKKDVKLAAKNVFLTTLLSIVTIPLTAALFLA